MECDGGGRLFVDYRLPFAGTPLFFIAIHVALNFVVFGHNDTPTCENQCLATVDLCSKETL